jgi:hypothetical protein
VGSKPLRARAGTFKYPRKRRSAAMAEDEEAVGAFMKHPACDITPRQERLLMSTHFGRSS